MRKPFPVILSLFLLRPAISHAQNWDTVLVRFEFNRSHLTPTADSVLHNYFEANKGLFSFQSISLAGYCDNTGDEDYNDRLSKDRAMAVRDYLVGHGVDSKIIQTRWFGKRDPLNDNISSGDRAMNRRVRIVIQKSGLGRAPGAPTVSPPVSPSVSSPVSPENPANPSPSAFDTASRPAQQSIYQQLNDTSTHVGTTIILRNVVFYGDRHLPLPLSYLALDDLLKAMRANPQLHIHIAGYVCCMPDNFDGRDADNGKPLSVERAKFVYQYLVNNGISRDRMTFAGYGASHKIFPEEADMNEREQNRRVELKVLAK
jgi:outer membrane protein OmpA-like peptidoglycan-associated protein